jgi:O-antigen/teichoic acid export membrane protein
MFKSLLKDTIVYGVSKYLGVFAAIFLMPIYTRLLTKADYGIMEIINSWNNFIIMLIPLGLSSSIIRFYSDIKDNPISRKKYLGSINVTLIVISAVYATLMIILKPFIIPFFNKFNGINEIYYHSIFIAIGAILSGHLLALLQAQLKKNTYLLVSIINLLMLVLLGFLFVYHYKMGVLGFYRASSIAYIVTLFFCFWFTRVDFSIKFSKKALKTILNYSIHILSVGILFSLVNLFDRYIIAEYSNVEGVGLYSIGVRISGIMGIAVASFSLAWFPISMNIKENKEAIQTYNRVHHFYYIVSTIMLVGLLLFRKELIGIFAPDYMKSYNVIGILGAQLIINGTIYFYSLGIHIKKRTKYLTYSGIISIIANIIISISLVKNYGIDGVAFGTLISSIIWVIIQFYFSHKLYPIPFKTQPVLISVIICSIAYFISPAIDSFFSHSLFISILAKGTIVLLLSIVLFLSLIGKTGLNEIGKILKNKNSKE